MLESVIELRVLYAHTDKMGVVNNARYLEYYEAGRNELLRKMGYPYTEFEKENIALPVIEANCKYILPAKYDDIVTIKSYLKEPPTVKIKIYYEVFVEDRIIATGYTIHSFVNFEKMKPVRPPEKFISILKNFKTK
jgi:acyl-CoA thioester hydrolase